MSIVGVVAIAENFAIGKNGKLPWHYAADLKFFKQATTDNAVVMGRKTFESIGAVLPNRLNIVLSHSKNLESQQDILLLHRKELVLQLAEYLRDDIFIIGGASIYAEFAGEIDKWLVTEIPQIIENADVFMPPDFLADFTVKEIIELGDDLRVKLYERNTI